MNEVQKPRKRILVVKSRIRDFGSDTNIASHLSGEFISYCLITRNVPKLVSALYRSQNAVQNHCVRYAQGSLYIYKDREWVKAKSKNHVLKEITETCYRILRRHFNAHVDDVYNTFIMHKKEPDMYGLDCWLEELWDADLPNMQLIYSEILDVLAQ